jgi:hypothetical protein
MTQKKAWMRYSGSTSWKKNTSPLPNTLAVSQMLIWKGGGNQVSTLKKKKKKKITVFLESETKYDTEFYFHI